MKKLIIPVILLLIVSVFAACGSNGGENTYTGDFDEYNSSQSTSNNPVESLSESKDSTVTVPLTTQAGNTVPTVLTTQPTTEFVTVNYDPIVPDTTKPFVATSYYSDPTATTLPTSQLYTQPTSTNTPTSSGTTVNTTKSELKYVTVDRNNDTDVSSTGTAGSNLVLTLSVNCADLTGKVVKSKGEATLDLDGEQCKATYKVQEKRDRDNENAILVTLDVSDLEIAEGSKITVTMPKGAIRTEDNVANRKFTSGVYYY